MWMSGMHRQCNGLRSFKWVSVCSADPASWLPMEMTGRLHAIVMAARPV